MFPHLADFFMHIRAVPSLSWRIFSFHSFFPPLSWCFHSFISQKQHLLEHNRVSVSRMTHVQPGSWNISVYFRIMNFTAWCCFTFKFNSGFCLLPLILSDTRLFWFNFPMLAMKTQIHSIECEKKKQTFSNILYGM